MLVCITICVLFFSRTQGLTGAEALAAAPVPETAGGPPMADDAGAPLVANQAGAPSVPEAAGDPPVVNDGGAPLVAGAVSDAQTVADQMKVRSLINHSISQPLAYSYNGMHRFDALLTNCALTYASKGTVVSLHCLLSFFLLLISTILTQSYLVACANTVFSHV